MNLELKCSIKFLVPLSGKQVLLDIETNLEDLRLDFCFHFFLNLPLVPVVAIFAGFTYYS